MNSAHDFQQIAGACQSNGWHPLVPIWPGKKNPMLNEWQHIAKNPLGGDELKSYPASAGIGFCYGGGDHVIGVDLDFTNLETADSAYEITLQHLGPSPLLRIGKEPKKLLLYRYAGHAAIGGKAFGGFEIFATSGQTLFFGQHPDTGRPYRWPYESPLTCTPEAAPEVTIEQLRALIAALRPYGTALPRRVYAPRTMNHEPCFSDTGSSDRSSGAVAEVLPHLREAADPISAAIGLIASAQPGGRYHRMFGAVMSLVILGFSDEEVKNAIFPAYRELLGSEWCFDRGHACQTALSFARKSVGWSAQELEKQAWVQSLQAEFMAAF